MRARWGLYRSLHGLSRAAAEGLLGSRGLALLHNAVSRARATKHTEYEEHKALEGAGWRQCHLPEAALFPWRHLALAATPVAVTCLLPLHTGRLPEQRQIKPEPVKNLSCCSFPSTALTAGLCGTTRSSRTAWPASLLTAPPLSAPGHEQPWPAEGGAPPPQTNQLPQDQVTELHLGACGGIPQRNRQKATEKGKINFDMKLR